jgi:hypothetical protein
MMKRFSIFILIIFYITGVHAQSKSTYFPSELLISPFKANYLEPKLGFQFSVGENNIRLDIGNSRDILHYAVDDKTTISFGADLFTYTKLRGETNFKFPVEAVDYLFGINSGYLTKEASSSYGYRFRYAHISAHLVDGQIKKNLADPMDISWRDNRPSFVYSREFLELTPFYSYKNLRGYVGFTYLLHTLPSNIKKGVLNAGAEFVDNEHTFGMFTPFAAYDLRTISLDKTSCNNTIAIGVIIGNPYKNAVRIQYIYYSGKSIHGEYYDVSEKYSAIGINLEL